MRVCSAVLQTLLQDFAVGIMTMWNLWKQRKAESRLVKLDLVRSRERGALAAIEAMEAIEAKERHDALAAEIEKVQAQLRAKQRPFRGHPGINEFLEQFSGRHLGELSRFRFLVLVGPSVQGKTSKGMSLHPGATLKVCCGGCPEGALPSLQAFDRSVHKAILFDEIRPDQVLKHREVFQANQYVQTLGQSACNAYNYQIWVYGIAFILCANAWDLRSDKLSPEDREWITANSIEVRLPEGERWYDGQHA